jgi:(1->4)-alpha-D-glucan 1-alpha-D-glucosylmutase
VSDPRLAELAERHGIATAYFDIWGKRHEASRETLRALLGAIGVDATDDSAVAAALAAHDRDRWRNVLPRALVVRRSALPGDIEVRLPDRLGAQRLEWRIDTEDGDTHHGAFVPNELPVREWADVEGDHFVSRALRIPVAPPLGYHRLAVTAGGRPLCAARFIVVPDRCYEPEAIQGNGRVWGATVQLYAVRSERNWGIGDFTDLRRLVEQWGYRGAGIVGVNPLHALYPHNPAHCSPYSPSSRLFFNALYLDVEAIDDFRESESARAVARSPEFAARLQRLRDAELVDYPAVAAAKRAVLEALYAHFRARHLCEETIRAAAFRAFQERGGSALRRHALFDALQERFVRDDPNVWGWPAWPQQYHDPDSPAVAAFAREAVARIEFFEYLQWQVDIQLALVGRRATELRLGVGVYQDLAVSVDRGGAEVWGNRGLYARASVGAPPDDFALTGQDWGLPPAIPTRLQEAAYEPFVVMLRANMAHSGALRIDHVMGLARLFWVPPGGKAADGAYVRYPFDDLLGLVALESHRNQCLVIGEDLGTVPDEVRAGLERTGILSYRLLLFERDAAGDFKPPGAYPRDALAACSTHDLPTLAGYWAGRDIALRGSLGLYPSEEKRSEQVVGRAQDRARLVVALEREGLIPADSSVATMSQPELPPAIARALHVYVARSPARIMVAQLEDVIGAVEQANLPGTVDQHPNWRRKLAVPIERLADDARFLDLTEALMGERGRSRPSVARKGRRGYGVRIPRATYRVQLNRDFTFRDAEAIVPYLAELGVSHLYCSPFLRARPGSTHGYDIIDHNALNPEIGSREDFDRLVDALHVRGMGLVADIVPNHMGVMGADNAWWLDVLENGQASIYADFFDIDWQPASPDLANRVLLPVLGEHYGVVLERGELTLGFDAPGGSFALAYYGHRFPVDPREYPRVLDAVVRSLTEAELSPNAFAELRSLVSAFGYLPSRHERNPDRRMERSLSKEVHKRRLAQLVQSEPVLGPAIERAVRSLNGMPGDAASFDALHDLLEAQAYRLAFWRVASDEINYRRFFDVNDLAGLRTENEAVFDATHRLVFDLLLEGRIDALRIDHPDGLYDPAMYFRRLQERYAQLAGVEAAADGGDGRPLYVLVEKIIAPFEHLPETWAVYGTTGYRFANVVNGVFVDAGAKAKITRAYEAFVDDARPLDEIEYQAKRLILRNALASELTVLANQLARLARADRRTRDYTLNTLRQALAEVIACFPVYRTYVTAQGPSSEDRRYIEWAVSRARRRSAGADVSIFDFVRQALLAELPIAGDPRHEGELRRFAMKAQQLTAPVMAKGVEDTAFYRYNRLISLNDVGGDPSGFGITLSAFHGASADRAAKWPHTMLATSTHDNKRSEDVRARIDVLSEMPAAWRLALRRWRRMNRSRKARFDGDQVPSANDEYLLYQTLIGSFPVGPLGAEALAEYRTRIQRYMQKAVREAKVHTSWVNVNEAYEAGVANFVDALLAGPEKNLFLDDFRSAAEQVAWLGLLNSVSIALVKMTSPGVPDLYQGNELFDFSLVDPDNRRPVDYARRRELLERLEAELAPGHADLAARVTRLFDDPASGAPKLYVIARSLALRRTEREVMLRGGYTPLAGAGTQADHVIAYARRHEGRGLVVVAGRLFAALVRETGHVPLGETVWGNTTVTLPFLEDGTRLTDALTGRTLEVRGGAVRMADAFAHFPGAMLIYESGERSGA